MSNFFKSKLFAMSLLGLLTMSFLNKVEEIKAPMKSIYDISIQSLEGEKIDLNQFKGKKILFVNVASKCGYTPQYKDLQALNDQYKDKLVIIGVPCNQFMSQEPGSNEEIAQFCERNYGVSFLITDKVKVKGDEQHKLYQWLTSKKMNGSTDSKVKWNFQKYLISETGELVQIFASGVNPLDEEIINYLK